MLPCAISQERSSELALLPSNPLPLPYPMEHLTSIAPRDPPWRLSGTCLPERLPPPPPRHSSLGPCPASPPPRPRLDPARANGRTRGGGSERRERRGPRSAPGRSLAGSPSRPEGCCRRGGGSSSSSRKTPMDKGGHDGSWSGHDSSQGMAVM